MILSVLVAAGVPVCPPAALQSGVGLLCRLLQQWEQVPAGAVALTEWLLGEGDGSHEAVADEASDLVRICLSACTYLPAISAAIWLPAHARTDKEHRLHL